MGQAKTQCVTFILSKVPRAKAKTQKHKTQTPPKSAKTHKTQNTKHYDLKVSAATATGAHRTSHTSHAIFAVSVLFVSS